MPSSPEPIHPEVSIIICTDGRADALACTLSSLVFLDHDSFEVIVVRGPTQDGTVRVLRDYGDRIKVAHNPERNLSISRNLGIRIARGEIVVFLDDDAIPERDWLTAITAPYADPEVGSSGGFVYGPDGYGYQYRFATANRMAEADLSWQRPAPELSFPFSENFPHLLGANISFRRRALLDVGGFDEEYEYYLDETDVTLRVLDAGWKIAQVEGGHVHHKFMASHIRNDSKVLRNWYPIFKNKIYFCLTHAAGRHSLPKVIDCCARFIDAQRQALEWSVQNGLLEPEFRHIFDDHTNRAWLDGMRAGTRGSLRTPPAGFWDAIATDFLPYATRRPRGGRKTYCLLSQTYPPGELGGIGRYIHQLACAVAGMGHDVHVITRASGHDTIDFEDGVWVHRVAPAADAAMPADLSALPEHIARYCDRVRREVEGIHAARTVAAVYCPIWDCEGYALLENAGFPLILSLQTTLKSFLKSNGHLASNPGFMRDFGEPMIAAERTMVGAADGIHALSHAIAADVASDYDTPLPPHRLAVIGLGSEDWARRQAPAPRREGGLRLLFVGRLEPRKAIDVVLRSAVVILARHPDVTLDVVGNDALPWSGGRPYRSLFEADPVADAIRDRVVFHGVVSDDRLREHYAKCDVLVTPSRYESFGLMLVEGMMFSKVVIGARAGGMPEVVEDGVSGFLVEPGDPDDLTRCLEVVLSDSGLRRSVGEAARRRYETEFAPARMAERLTEFIDAIAESRQGGLAGSGTRCAVT
jgi:glycogen(starch) synthase